MTKSEQAILLLKNKLLKQVRSRNLQRKIQRYTFSESELIHLMKILPKQKRRSLNPKKRQFIATENKCDGNFTGLLFLE
jgi:hypothetical protein